MTTAQPPRLTIPIIPILAQSKSPMSMLLYGPPKIGKTAIVAALPDLLLLEFDVTGAEHVTARKMNLSSLKDLEDVAQLVKELPAEQRPKYVCIDTISAIEDLCEEHATLEYKTSAQGKNFTGKSVLELPNGGGYMWLRFSFHKYFNLVKTIAPRVIFIGHIRDKQLGTVGGKEVAVKDIDLTGKIKNIACAYCDCVGYVTRIRKNTTRPASPVDNPDILYVSFQTSDELQCGSRCSHLRNQLIPFTYPEATAEDWKQIYKD